MIVAVVPARNEAASVKGVAVAALRAGADRVLVVDNGSTDATARCARSLGRNDIKVLEFRVPLGHDVPRAVGTALALKEGAKTVLFLDGDMSGKITPILVDLLDSSRKGLDLALCQCLPVRVEAEGLARTVLAFRRLLNVELGIHNRILVATPSHGPHVASRRLLEGIPLRDIAVPPVFLARAALGGFRVGIGTVVAHRKLGSPDRSEEHGEKIGETIIGDCIEALCLVKGRARTREWAGKEYLGYAPERRWDLLDAFLARVPPV